MQGIKGNKTTLFAAIVLLIFAAMFGVLLIAPISQYKDSQVSYEDLIKVSYTYKSIERHLVYRSSYYSIYVEEEDKPLHLAGIYGRAVDNDVLDKLQAGDGVDCYVRRVDKYDYTYELVEMRRGDDYVIALENHVARGKSNAIVGMAVVPVLGGSIAGLAIYMLVMYKKGKA